MQITQDIRVSAILLKYGDIADVIEIFDVERVGRYSLRMFLAKALTVKYEVSFIRATLPNSSSIHCSVALLSLHPIREEHWGKPLGGFFRRQR